MADEDRKLVVRNALKPMGKRGFPGPAENLVLLSKKNITPTIFLRPTPNFDSLTICSLEQYLQNGSENKILLP